jgi:hypothetical protein
MTSSNEQRAPAGSQQAIDQWVLAYHREIARRLLAEPEAVLAKARGNLKRWMPVHAGTGTAQALEEWQRLLDTRSVSQLIAIITEDSDEGQRLRSSTPFVGILSDQERRELREGYEERELV